MARDRFIRRKAQKRKASPSVVNIYGHLPVKGAVVGLEIEMEGNKFPKPNNSGKDLIPPEWKYTKDGSLRGLDNAEYIFAKPLPFSQVDRCLDNLWDMLDKYGSKLDDSNRTSVHVHMNVQEWHLNRVTSFLALYFAVEEILTEWCGDHRVGNLFCLRAKDATGIVAKVKDFIASDGQIGFPEGMHYSGCNLHALGKFGTIEIRALRGCTDKNDIKTWVSILRRLYDLSAEYPDPRQVVEGFSGEGPMAYLERILGPYTGTVLEGIDFDHQDVMDSMYEGIRQAQDVAYCRDWDEFEADKSRVNPFGRKRKTSASSAAEIYLEMSSANPVFATEWPN